MWVITPELAVSVVSKDPTGQGRLCVRARTRNDLDQLRRRYCPTLSRPTKGAGTDYEWRSYTSPEGWASACARMAFAVDYPNMKARVRNDHRHDVYLDIWVALRRLAHPARRRQLPLGGYYNDYDDGFEDRMLS